MYNKMNAIKDTVTPFGAENDTIVTQKNEKKMKNTQKKVNKMKIVEQINQKQ